MKETRLRNRFSGAKQRLAKRSLRIFKKTIKLIKLIQIGDSLNQIDTAQLIILWVLLLVLIL